MFCVSMGILCNSLFCVYCLFYIQRAVKWLCVLYRVMVPQRLGWSILDNWCVKPTQSTLVENWRTLLEQRFTTSIPLPCTSTFRLLWSLQFSTVMFNTYTVSLSPYHILECNKQPDIHLTAFSLGLLSTSRELWINHSGFYWTMRRWVAMASAGPYTNHLHFAPNRKPHQHLAGCCSWYQTNSMKANVEC